MRPPSIDWQERIAPDEQQRFERYASEFVRFQRRRSKRFGNGRALHRKQHLALRARLTVDGGLPPHAAQGLFAVPGTHDCVLRLSSASMDVQPDRVPDIRGFAIKVLGVRGAGALGGRTDAQDFVLINLPTFRLANSEPFAGVVIARSKGNAAAAWYLVRRYGLLHFVERARHGVASLRWPFSGFATEPFHSAAPIACGRHAVRVRIAPRDAGAANIAGSVDWADDMRTRLRRGPVEYVIQLQFFVDESITPIEDASVDWPVSEAPYVDVGRLTIPQQETSGAEAERLQEDVATASFDPWHALVEHRPLGEVMRARRVVYYASQRERAAASNAFSGGG